MERFEDQGIVLAARAHGENGAIVSLLTPSHGRAAGYVRGAHSSKMRGTLELGNIVDVSWQARSEDQLGSFSLELVKNPASRFMADPLRLAALQSACALCDQALPEREGHAGLYFGLEALLGTLESEVWAAAYVMWEIALLKELGFSLKLDTCAGGGSADTLTYVSPKTGRAVSAEEGEPYKDRLLALPAFLKPQSGGGDEADILKGLKMTAYFLEHWVFVHHTKGVPESRLRFQERFGSSFFL